MDDPNEPFEPANLRFLRRLVTVLTAVMICGLLVIIGLFVTRLGTQTATLPLPEVITLPDGTTAEAFTQTRDWYAVVTTDGEILVYSRRTNTLHKTIPLD